MKEMKYQAQRKVEVLDTGFCFGLLYYIMSLGTHPTAYIRIPKGHKLYGKDDAEIYQKIDIGVHGGITYISDSITIENIGKVDGWIIGWDYGHYGDYMGIEESVPTEFRTGGKKWTTQEIYKEVREACYQIQKGEYKR